MKNVKNIILYLLVIIHAFFTLIMFMLSPLCGLLMLTITIGWTPKAQQLLSKKMRFPFRFAIFSVLFIASFYFVPPSDGTNAAKADSNVMKEEKIEDIKVSEEESAETAEVEETEENIETSVEEAKEESVQTTQEEKVEEAAETKEEITFNTSIKGRGSSDSGRNEPEYVGLYGYISTDDSKIRNLKENFNNYKWNLPTFKKIDYDHYEENGTLEHKTVVKVLEQDLTHQGWGRYDGYLTVCLPQDENTKYLIDVSDFITNAYWEFSSIVDAVKYGPVVAKYNQKSDKLPVYVDNEIVNVPEGTMVLVIGKTGMYGGKNVDDDLRQLETRYYDKNGNEFRVFFNKDDLTITY